MKAKCVARDARVTVLFAYCNRAFLTKTPIYSGRERCDNVRAHTLDIADAVDAHKLRRTVSPCICEAAEVRNQRLGLFVIDLETLLHHLFPVILALDQILSREVVFSRPGGRIELDVVGAPGAEMHSPTAHSAYDLTVVDVDFHHVIDVDSLLFERLRLGNGPRESVEQETVGTVGFGYALFDEIEDQLV